MKESVSHLSASLSLTSLGWQQRLDSVGLHCSVITGPFSPHLDVIYVPPLVHPEFSGLRSRPTSP